MNEYVREYAKVERRALRRGRFLVTYAPWLVLLAAASIFGRVWTQTQAVRLVDEVTRMKAEERETLLAREERERRLVGLTTRERIADVAREELRMDYPTEGEVVFLPVPAAAQPAAAARPRRIAPRENGLVAFLRGRLQGLVNQDAYALSTM